MIFAAFEAFFKEWRVHPGFLHNYTQVGPHFGGFIDLQHVKVCILVEPRSWVVRVAQW
jgi:hypothetical protein